MLFQDRADFGLTAPREDKVLRWKGDEHADPGVVYKHILISEKYGVLTGKK